MRLNLSISYYRCMQVVEHWFRQLWLCACMSRGALRFPMAKNLGGVKFLHGPVDHCSVKHCYHIRGTNRRSEMVQVMNRDTGYLALFILKFRVVYADRVQDSLLNQDGFYNTWP